MYWTVFCKVCKITLSEYFGQFGVILVVDGTRYKLVPANQIYTLGDEMEERLISYENVISNFTRYIIEAYLPISERRICEYVDSLERILKLFKEKL